jgi:Spy/CpxP family protein refolding chaperone
MKSIARITAALLFGATAMAAFAQTPPAPPADGKDGRGHRPMMRDCSKIEDADHKSKCEARQKVMKAAMEKCKDKAEGEERRKCMRESLPPPPDKK